MHRDLYAWTDEAMHNLHLLVLISLWFWQKIINLDKTEAIIKNTSSWTWVLHSSAQACYCSFFAVKFLTLSIQCQITTGKYQLMSIQILCKLNLVQTLLTKDWTKNLKFMGANPILATQFQNPFLLPNWGFCRKLDLNILKINQVRAA